MKVSEWLAWEETEIHPEGLRGWDPRQSKGLLNSGQLLHARCPLITHQKFLNPGEWHAFKAQSAALGKFPLPSPFLCPCKSPLCSWPFLSSPSGFSMPWAQAATCSAEMAPLGHGGVIEGTGRTAVRLAEGIGSGGGLRNYLVPFFSRVVQPFGVSGPHWMKSCLGQ